MSLGQGFPEWTELGQDTGLDPLGMLQPIEGIYQSLLPGISTITLRYRYYSFFSFILKHYEEHIRHSDPAVFRKFQRRCEALYALISTYGERELGITGSDWAERILNEISSAQGADGLVDFAVAADENADFALRYLRNKAGAFGAIYATQMSEIGLLHFPEEDQPNPNPVCSDKALQLAAAFAQELGPTADAFFRVVEDGRIPLSSLAAFDAMRPSRVRAGSEEHRILKNILFGHFETARDPDLWRRYTVRLLLSLAEVLKATPRAEQVKWHWFETVPVQQTDALSRAAQLWFLYQACDLIRLAYEVLLSASLTLLQRAPRKRMPLGSLVEELTAHVAFEKDESWEDFSQRLTMDATVKAVQDCTRAMLEAKDDLANQIRNAVQLIALVCTRATPLSALVEEALDGADYFQSLRTEMRYLQRVSSQPAERVIANMLRDRIIRRHLWVASRKFRKQKAYTFHMEPEEGLLRYRSHFRISPSSPRIEQALRFLSDISMINSEGLTPLGRAELEAA